MASHFSDIGFLTANQDEVVKLAIQAAESGVRYTTSLGDYIVWSLGEGAELWAHVMGDDEITQLHPHYAGTSRMLCSITDLIHQPEYPLEGSISGWACVTPEHPDTGAYPLTANIPDFVRHFHGSVLPIVILLQVTAFAQQVIYFPDDDAFNAFQVSSQEAPCYNLVSSDNGTTLWQHWFSWLDKLSSIFQSVMQRKARNNDARKKQLDAPPTIVGRRQQCIEYRMGAESYVPIGGPRGFFTDAHTDIEPDGESVLMSGHILTSQLHTNPETGKKFFAMTLRVQEGAFDVVADKQLFGETHPVPGGILQGSFWLSARIAR